MEFQATRFTKDIAMSQSLEPPTTHTPSNSIPTSAETALESTVVGPTDAAKNRRMRWTIGTITSWGTCYWGDWIGVVVTAWNRPSIQSAHVFEQCEKA